MSLKKLASQAMGSRYQMVTDGKQVFLVDLKNGRVWRYFHNTKEAGFSKEDEGFLPMALYYAGQKHYAASEIEPPPGAPGSPPRPHRRGSSRNEPGVAAGPGLGRVHPGGGRALRAGAAVAPGAPVLAGRIGRPASRRCGTSAARNSSRE